MIERVHADPPLIWRLYEPDEEAFYIDEIGAGKKPGFFGRLFGSKEIPVPDPLPKFEYSDGDRFDVELDKSWDGINFCVKKLQSQETPNLFEDGRPVRAVEIGYAPPMTFDALTTKQLSNAYQIISAADIIGELQPTLMGEVYPEALWERGDSDTKEYLKEHFECLQSYLKAAADRGLGIVIFYT